MWTPHFCTSFLFNMFCLLPSIKKNLNFVYAGSWIPLLLSGRYSFLASPLKGFSDSGTLTYPFMIILNPRKNDARNSAKNGKQYKFTIIDSPPLQTVANFATLSPFPSFWGISCSVPIINTTDFLFDAVIYKVLTRAMSDVNSIPFDPYRKMELLLFCFDSKIHNYI